MAAGVIADAGADAFGDFAQVGDECIDVERGKLGMIFEEIVGVGDVRLVVFAVMDFHRLRVDVRREGVVGVRQFREFVGHDEEFSGFIEMLLNL